METTVSERKFLSEKHLGLKTEILILRSLRGQDIFKSLDEHVKETDVVDSHLITLIKMIVKEYLKVRFHHVSKEISADVKGKSIRQKLTKSIIFACQ